MTVQTDESSAAAETCSVTGCYHAVLMADCSTLWAVEGEALYYFDVVVVLSILTGSSIAIDLNECPRQQVIKTIIKPFR